MKVLIVKVGAIGDVVMALPMVDILKNVYVDCHITWMCGESAAALLKHVNTIDNLITLNEKALFSGEIGTRFSAIWSIWAKLFGKQYDLIVTAHADIRYRILTLTAIGRVRRKFERNSNDTCPIPGRHHSDEYIRLVTNRHRPNIAQTNAYPVEIPVIDKVMPFLKLTQRTPLVALAPGGAKNALREDEVRRWPVEYYVSLAKKLLVRGYKVVITGAESDEWVEKKFYGLEVIDLIGATSILELIALYRCCSVVITHDSGPLHLAGLANCPIIALFGPTNPYEKVPRNRHAKFLWNKDRFACCPCYDGRKYALCDNNLCLKSISVDDVYSAVLDVIAKGKCEAQG